MKGSRDKCWYCGSSNMKAVGTWFQCQDCMATHVPQTETGHYPSTVREDLSMGQSGSPSALDVKEAAAARETKGP